jgi:hypothetical protein
LLQITITTRRRRMTLQPSQRGFTDACTFMEIILQPPLPPRLHQPISQLAAGISRIFVRVRA